MGIRCRNIRDFQLQLLLWSVGLRRRPAIESRLWRVGFGYGSGGELFRRHRNFGRLHRFGSRRSNLGNFARVYFNVRRGWRDRFRFEIQHVWRNERRKDLAGDLLVLLGGWTTREKLDQRENQNDVHRDGRDKLDGVPFGGLFF